MLIPPWVLEELCNFESPETGKVTIALEIYKGGITKIEIGSILRIPSGKSQIKGSSPTA